MLIDEAYHPFYPESAITWVEEHPHLIVTRSTAKAWGMAGFRVGYAAASPAIAPMLHKVNPMYEISTVGAAVFEAMLDHTDAMARSVAKLKAGKDSFLSAMKDLGFRTLDGGGNFCHVAFGTKAATVHQALEGVAYYRRDFEHPSLEGFCRFSAAPTEKFQPVIDAIRDAIRKGANT